MKSLKDKILESLEVETMATKAKTWLRDRPDEAQYWKQAVNKFCTTHQHDDEAISQFINTTDIKGFMQFMQDDVSTDVSSMDPTQTIKQIISNI